MHPSGPFRQVRKPKSTRSVRCASSSCVFFRPNPRLQLSSTKMQAAKPVHIVRAWFLLALAFAFGNASAATSAAPDAGEATVSSPDSLPLEILQAAAQGDMQKVLEWLDKGGSVDAVYSYSVPTRNARKGTSTSWPFMPTPEEVGKEIDLSVADLSYSDFALDLDLDEDNVVTRTRGRTRMRTRTALLRTALLTLLPWKRNGSGTS